jgi:hypothetical protein
MDLTIFQDHTEHRFSAHEVKEQLHKLHEDGHLDDRQYTTLKGGLEAIASSSDHTVTGAQIHHWLHNAEKDYGDHLSTEKIHDRVAPALASLLHHAK